MEDGTPNLGLEDGTTDVEGLLVEPRDGHVSMDSVICFNEKMIPENNTMAMEDVSHSFGGSETGIDRERKDILNGEVLDAMPSEVEAGYFRLHNDFCCMGEDYLLGVQFAESITNLEYGSSEVKVSVPNNQMRAFSAGSDTTSKSHLHRVTKGTDCENDQFNIGSSEPSDIPGFHECKLFVGEKQSISPTSCTLQNIGKFHYSSSSSFEDILSDESNGRHSLSSEMLCSPNTEKHNEFELTDRAGETKIFEGQEEITNMSPQARFTDVFPTTKRSRKPTQRYIDQLADPILSYSKKRREVSSSTLRNKSRVVKDHKKCHLGSKAVKLPAEEESSVKAIQVPFATFVPNDCPKGNGCDTRSRSDHVTKSDLVTKSKGKRSTPENRKNRDECITTVYLKRKEDYEVSERKRDDCVIASYLKKVVDRKIAACQKKRNENAIVLSPKKRDGRFAALSKIKWDDNQTTLHQNCPKKRDGHYAAISQIKWDDGHTAVHQNEREISLAAESSEEVSGRRKHHRLWSVSEVKKLIDGVSQYGVGRWSRIKKLFFSTSPHRTSVDLKDKWRNLLKASGIQEKGNRQGDKKRNVAWRPLPKSILRRVCELATMHPYPKCERPPKIGHMHHDDSPDRSTEITLNDYRKILRSINGS